MLLRSLNVGQMPVVRTRFVWSLSATMICTRPMLSLRFVYVFRDTPLSFFQASLNSPSIQTLTKWKKAVFAVSEEAFEALGEVYNMRDEKVDPSAISLNFLTKREFIELRKKPPAQLLAIYIMARYVTRRNTMSVVVCLSMLGQCQESPSVPESLVGNTRSPSYPIVRKRGDFHRAALIPLRRYEMNLPEHTCAGITTAEHEQCIPLLSCLFY